MPNKIRKTLTLNVGQRKEIIKFRNENPTISYRKMAAFFAEKWHKNVNRGHIERAIVKSEKILAIPKKMNKMERLPTDSEILLYEEVYKEFLVRIQYSPVTMEILQLIIKELAVHEKYRGDFSNFVFGEQWIRRWKDIYGVRYKKIKGNRKLIPAVDIENAQKNIAEKITQYRPEVVYNSDTSAVNPHFNGSYSLQPSSGHFVIKKGDAKKRISINSVANSTGTVNLSYLIVKNFNSKFPAHRCVEIKKHALFWRKTYISENGDIMLIYRNTKAWLTKAIHEDFMAYFSEKCYQKYGNEKVLLILDNFSGHKIDYSRFPNIDVQFLPPNLTGYMQPLDMGFFSTFKERFYKYRREFIQKHQGKKEPPEWELHQKMFEIANEISPNLIQTFWKLAKLIPGDGSPEEQLLLEQQEEIFDVFFFENQAESQPPEGVEDPEDAAALSDDPFPESDGDFVYLQPLPEEILPPPTPEFFPPRDLPSPPVNFSPEIPPPPIPEFFPTPNFPTSPVIFTPAPILCTPEPQIISPCRIQPKTPRQLFSFRPYE